MYLLHGFWALPEGTCECEMSVVTPPGFVLGGRFLWLRSPFLPLPLTCGWGEARRFVGANARCMLSLSFCTSPLFRLFQVAAKCYQKGGAFEKEKLALAHDAALNMTSKKVSPK